MTASTVPTTNSATPPLPDITTIAATFDRDGYALIPGLIQPGELKALQDDTAPIVFGGWEDKANPTDYMHRVFPQTGEDIFFRVQYIFPKTTNNAIVALLGHPYVLSVVREILGPDFILSAEALVFKMQGNGHEVAVHADCDPADPRLSPTIFNVDYYFDDSTVENGCVWMAPGTHKLNLSSKEISQKGFDFPGLVPVAAKAGDVLLHNVRVVHGSRATPGGALRRTMYYEWQSLAEMEKQTGPRPGFPMNDSFVRDRYRLLLTAIDLRRRMPYAKNETPFGLQIPSDVTAKYGIEPIKTGEQVNLRPALGYNAYI